MSSPASLCAAHVEAFRSTGSSPGRASRADSLTLPRRLARCGLVQRVPVRYEVQGPPDEDVVVVLGGISAGRHIAPAASVLSRKVAR